MVEMAVIYLKRTTTWRKITNNQYQKLYQQSDTKMRTIMTCLSFSKRRE